ncbi:hypothetical protein DICPUDRAFT_36609, partial [Dictyostelium purpureum]
DPNYETLKREFKRLYENCNSVKNSLLSYTSYIKELYLSPNSIYNSLTQFYDNQHPLSKYSSSILQLIDAQIKNWEINEFNGHYQKILDYSLSIDQIHSTIQKVDRLSSEVNNEQKKSEYIHLKSSLFNETSQLFDNKAECFEKPLINIQLSFNNLIQSVHSILNNSSPLLQTHINNQNNHILNLYPNNDFLNKPVHNHLDGPSTITQQPSPSLVKQPLRPNPPISSPIQQQPPQRQQQQQRPYKPNTKLNKLQVWQTIPENIQNQFIRKATFTALDGIDLYKVNLVEVTDPNEVVQFEPISQRDIDIYLRPTDKLNFDTPEFEQFIQENGFYPKQFEDGSMEKFESTSHTSKLSQLTAPTKQEQLHHINRSQYQNQPQQLNPPKPLQQINKSPIQQQLKTSPIQKPPLQQQQQRPVSAPSKPAASETKSGFSLFKKSAESIQKLKFHKIPPLDQLVDHHEYHKFFWDNKRYKLVKTYNGSVSVNYDFTLKYKPNTKLSTLQVWQTIPETIQNQFIRKATFTVLDGNNNSIIDLPSIVDSSHQKLFCFKYNPFQHPNKLHFICRANFEVDLYKVNLVEVTDPNEVVQFEPISQRDIDIYLRPTEKLNYDTPEFEQFIQENGFYPKQFEDGSMESVLCFAYRIYLFQLKNFTYKYPHTLSGKPIETFKAKYGDCGCHSFFFTSIMRYNNIPTRLLFGRGANLNNNSDPQWHVKTDIYLDQVGWVPMDVTCKDFNGPHTHLIGNDSGDHITFGMDYLTDIQDLSKYSPFPSFQLMNMIHFGHNVELESTSHTSKLSQLTAPTKQDQFSHINQSQYQQLHIQTIGQKSQPTVLQQQQQPQQQQQQQQQQQRSTPQPASQRPVSFHQQQPVPNRTVPTQQQPVSQRPQEKDSSFSNSISSFLSNATKSLNISNNGLPSKIHVDQLINDHNLHKKLWDKRFKLVKKYNYSVSTLYTKKIIFSPDSKLNEIKFYMGIPLNINNQQVRYSSFTLHDSNDQCISQASIVKSLVHDCYLLAYKPNPGQVDRELTWKYRVDVDFYTVTAEEVTNPNEQIDFDPISEKEIDLYLRPSDKMKFDTPEFEQFIFENNLYPKQFDDGTMESVLCFAYRVSLFIYKNIQYKNPYSHNGDPISTFKAGHGDCGCHSWLFGSILRYNNIPVRLLYGRGGLLDKPGDKQIHIKNQFYVEGLGFVPYDGAFKDGNPYHKKYFAHDIGSHVTTGLDIYTDIEGRKNEFSFQNPAYFYIGNVKIESSEEKYDVFKL